jgi:hypothetical protein
MKHIDEETCPCEPVIFFTYGNCNVLVHYGESGDIPTAGLLVSAIRLCIQNEHEGKHGNISVEPNTERSGE